jgi:hypothetical protein
MALIFQVDKDGHTRPTMPIDHFMLSILNNIQLTPGALEEAGRKLREATSI